LESSWRSEKRRRAHLGVPIRVKENDSVRSLEVNAEATCAGGEHEEKVRRVRCIELAHELTTIFRFGVAIEAHVHNLPPPMMRI